MVNFMGHLNKTTRYPDIWLNIISGYVCEGVLVRDYHLNLLDWVKQFALPEWMGILQPVQGLYRTRKRRKVEFCLSD